MPDIDINVPDSKYEKEEEEDSKNIVNIHDPFFLWGLFEHSDRALMQALKTLSDADCSRLYWSCHYHKHIKVCQFILDNYAPVCIARDAMEQISQIAKTGDRSKTPDLSQIPVPFFYQHHQNLLLLNYVMERLYHQKENH